MLPLDMQQVQVCKSSSTPWLRPLTRLIHSAHVLPTELHQGANSAALRMTGFPIVAVCILVLYARAAPHSPRYRFAAVHGSRVRHWRLSDELQRTDASYSETIFSASCSSIYDLPADLCESVGVRDRISGRSKGLGGPRSSSPIK